jgi:hypothetical protein
MEKWLSNPKQQPKSQPIKPFQVRLKEQMKTPYNDKDQHSEDGMSTTSSQSTSSSSIKLSKHIVEARESICTSRRTHSLFYYEQCLENIHSFS